MPDIVSAVLVGCGGIAGAWLHAAKDIPQIAIKGLVDLNKDAAVSRAKEFGLESAVIGPDLSLVLDQVKPDVVFDCTVPEAHVEVALKALARGCHVLGEKPLADSMVNARRILKASREAGRIHAVIQNRRYDPNIRRLFRLLDTGKIGPTTTVNCDFYIGAHFGGFRDRMKHVLLLDMAIHTFDAARLITGADPVSVYCKEWNPAGSWYDHDASAIAIFEMTGGVIFTYRGSWCAEGLNTTWESSWRIVGQQGTVTWNGAEAFEAETVNRPEGFFYGHERLEVPLAESDARVGGHAGVLREFVECVTTGKTPETVCSDNIKSLAMVFAAIESAEKGALVPVNWE